MTKTKDQETIPVPLAYWKGQYTTGDAGSVSDGFARAIENLLPRPGRAAARAPFAYDSLMAVNGLAQFDDPANNVTRLVAIDTAHNLYEKGSSGETWSGALTGTTGTRLTSFANFRYPNGSGRLYYLQDDGSGVPSAAFSFDGTRVSTTPFNSAITARAIVTAKGRVFLGGPRVSVANAFYSMNLAYVVTGGISGTWVPTNVNRANLTSGATIVGRMWPTSTAAGACSVISGGSAGHVVTDAYRRLVWRANLRGVDPTFRVPFTMEVLIYRPPLINTAFAVGDVITSGGYLYRCTTAGTSAAVAPAYGVILGATTADNTVTWTNIGTDVVSALEGYVPSASDVSTFSTFYLSAEFPRFTNASVEVKYQFKFYNTSSPACTTLAAVDFSERDGVTDGDPTKRCYGQQVTNGDFLYPFFNRESTGSASIDMPDWCWSELFQPERILASNTYQPADIVETPTGACEIGGRLLGFYRRSFIQWQFTDDPDIPIRLEKTSTAAGCIGSIAFDVHDNEVFFIGNNECYRYKVGGEPVPFCGDGMRETMFNKSSSSWVEAQSTYKRPLLAIDKDKLVVWVYTQKGKLFAFDLRTQQWSTHYVTVSGSNVQIETMAYNPNTANMYVAFESATYGLAKMDYSTSANDTIDNTVNTYAGSISITFRPIELGEGDLYEVTCEEIRIRYASSIAQSGQTVTAALSYNQGVTFPVAHVVTPSVQSTSGEYQTLPIAIRRTGGSLTLKLTRTGKLGETSWSLSPKAVAHVTPMRGEYPTKPTAGSYTG